MNGPNSFTNRHLLGRREFLKLSAAGALVSGLGILASKIHVKKRLANKNIPGQLLGSSHKFGHLLRDPQSIPVHSSSKVPVLIVGAGIAGLSAGWWLKKQGFSNFKIIELESEAGGNSRSGKNELSAYPWAAHYVPIPNQQAEFVKDFFRECGVITGKDATGLDIYNEDYLCNDPHERLFFQGTWQDGLIPAVGLSSTEQAEMKAFLALTESYKLAKGKDGKKAFAIPLDFSSQDEEFTKLDRLSMKDFLALHHFDSAPLHWYVNYCCRDDYGATYDKVSAWAGIHYFAGRYGTGSNADSNTVLTWPEGNGWLVEKLREKLTGHILTNSMAMTIERNEHTQSTKVYSTVDQIAQLIESQQLIFAAPRYLWPYIAPKVGGASGASAASPHLDYDPWMVANISVSSLPAGQGAPLSWDNVSYYSPSLGYVLASQQAPVLKAEHSVLTYYRPLSDQDPKLAREWALKRSHGEWVSDIVDDLEQMHEGLSHFMSNIDVWIWGHAMIRPRVGFMWSKERAALKSSIANRIHFAHSDMSGISIFEEAQYHGIMAAKKVLMTAR